jgi:hypothetical protein
MHISNDDEYSLPADLAAIERQLEKGSRPASTSDPRQRILDAVGRELSRQPIQEQPKWRWLAAAAAAFLIVHNFSTSVVYDMDWHLNGGLRHGDLHVTARQVHNLVPDMSPQEACRQALLFRAGERALPMPGFQSSLDQVLKQRERELWDIH